MAPASTSSLTPIVHAVEARFGSHVKVIVGVDQRDTPTCWLGQPSRSASLGVSAKGVRVRIGRFGYGIDRLLPPEVFEAFLDGFRWWVAMRGGWGEVVGLRPSRGAEPIRYVVLPGVGLPIPVVDDPLVPRPLDGADLLAGGTRISALVVVTAERVGAGDGPVAGIPFGADLSIADHLVLRTDRDHADLRWPDRAGLSFWEGDRDWLEATGFCLSLVPQTPSWN